MFKFSVGKRKLVETNYVYNKQKHSYSKDCDSLALHKKFLFLSVLSQANI